MVLSFIIALVLECYNDLPKTTDCAFISGEQFGIGMFCNDTKM